MSAYDYAKSIYHNIGVDTDLAIEELKKISLSLQCWQGDDVKGFLFGEQELTGGIQVTGAYPYRARTPEELRNDLKFALSLIPGNHKVNLHAIYADTPEKVDLNELEPRHFASWVSWAKEQKIGLDFNPTCFSHQKSNSGFTLSSNDPDIQSFWIEHVRRSRKIGDYFTKSLGQKAVVNLWIPDGYKDTPYDRISPRNRLESALDVIYNESYDIVDTVESKLFGIGSEAYTVGSHEFYLGYALKHQIGVCLDTGHFHPTESVSDKLASLSSYMNDILLHVSRPMRWDSDHVVILDDELEKIAQVLIRGNILSKVHLGFDYFDASISRIAAWVIGARSFQLALLKALLEPQDLLVKIEKDMDYSKRLYYQEMLKSLPYGLVYDEFLRQMQVPSQTEWFDRVKAYEKALER
jgi:L-rhamnose isomerase